MPPSDLAILIEHVCKQVVRISSSNADAFLPQHLFHRFLRQTLFPASCVVFPRMHSSALPLFSLSMFCTVPSLIFPPDRSDISSAILLNGIHCTIEVCHQCTEVVTILDTTVGSFAVVYATAFTDLLVILFLTGLYDHLDINNLCPYGFSGMVYQSRADHSF